MSGQRCVLPVLEWSEKYQEFYSPYVIIKNKSNKIKKTPVEIFTEKLVKLNLKMNEDSFNIVSQIKNNEMIEFDKTTEAVKEIYNIK